MKIKGYCRDCYYFDVSACQNSTNRLSVNDYCSFFEEKFSKTIGGRLKELLKINNKKYKDLADYLGVGENVISYYCSNKRKPSVDQIIKISDYFDVTCDCILKPHD